MNKDIIKAGKKLLKAYVSLKAGDEDTALEILSSVIENNEDGIDKIMEGIASSLKEIEKKRITSSFDEDDDDMFLEANVDEDGYEYIEAEDIFVDNEEDDYIDNDSDLEDDLMGDDEENEDNTDYVDVEVPDVVASVLGYTDYEEDEDE